MASDHVHPCGIVGDHVGTCNECGEHAELGWAHVCRPCWDRITSTRGGQR